MEDRKSWIAHILAEAKKLNAMPLDRYLSLPELVACFRGEKDLMNSLLDLYKDPPHGFHHVETRYNSRSERVHFGWEVRELHTRLRIIKVTLADKKLKVKRILSLSEGGTDAAVSKVKQSIKALKEERKQLNWCLDVARSVVAEWRDGEAAKYVDYLTYSFTFDVLTNKYEMRRVERELQEEEEEEEELQPLQEKKLNI